MRYSVKHEGPGSLHIDLTRTCLTDQEADILYYALIGSKNVNTDIPVD
jgi:hypothetical protein